MNTLEAIQSRRAIKQYIKHSITEDEIQKLFEAVILSPTSFNIQNWRFVIVKDPEQRKALRKASWDQAQVEEASLLVVLTADLKAWKKNTERYWSNAPTEVAQLMVSMTHQFYEGKEQLQRDEAIRSCGIAAQTLMLRAKEMGYDTCPMIGFDPAKVSEIINLPEDHIIALMITIGKAAEPARSRNGQLKLEELLILDKFKS